MLRRLPSLFRGHKSCVGILTGKPAVGSPCGYIDEAGNDDTGETDAADRCRMYYRSYSNEVRPGISSSTRSLSSRTPFMASQASSYSQRREWSASCPPPWGENHKTGHFSTSPVRGMILTRRFCVVELCRSHLQCFVYAYKLRSPPSGFRRTCFCIPKEPGFRIC